MDTLAGRLGAQRVVRIRPMESHLPERAFTYKPALQASFASTNAADTVAMTESERPSHMFDPPEPIEVREITPDGPPSWMHWRGHEQKIITSIGPERIAHEWWHTEIPAHNTTDHGASMTSSPSSVLSLPRSRDYFKIQDQCGRWFWVYREVETGHWFVHGHWA